MRQHWRIAVWLLLWLVPLPLMPDHPVSALYWLYMVCIAGWVFRLPLVLETRSRVTDDDLWAWLDG